MNMPLKTKRPSPRAKTAKCNSSKVPGGSSKKVVTRPLGKSAAGGKKPMRNPARTRAGYELYSSDSDDCLNSDRRCQQSEVSAAVTTLVEEWMAKQVAGDNDPHAESMPKSGTVQKKQGLGQFGSGPDKTPFNRRLVSSTPDPELLEEDVQLIPERDTVYHQHASSVPNAQGVHSAQSCEGQGLLTDTERDHLRQQIDAALLEEGQEVGWQQKHRLQQQPQQRHQSSEVPSVPALSGKNDSAAQQHSTHQQAAAGSVPSNQRKQDISQERHNAPAPPPQSTWRGMLENGLATRGSDIGVFHHFLHRESADNLPPSFMPAGGRGDGDCQMFVPQTHSGVTPDMSMGFVPVGEATGMFHPLSSFAPAFLRQSLSSAGNFHPLAVATETSRDNTDDATAPKVLQSFQVHSATPASSPVRQHENVGPLKPAQTNQKLGQNTQRKERKDLPLGKVDKNAYKPASKTGCEIQTPATSPEVATPRSGQRVPAKQASQPKPQLKQRSGVDNSPSSSFRAIRGRAAHKTNDENASGNSGKAKGPRRNAEKAVTGNDKGFKLPVNHRGDDYTKDGYYINRCVDDVSESEPQPCAFLPTPMQSPKVPNSHFHDSQDLPQIETDQRELNRNNSSDTYEKQGEEDHRWMHMRRGAPAARASASYCAPDFLHQMKPAREAMAEADFASMPLSVARAMMMMAEDHEEMDDDPDPCPPASAPAPMTSGFRTRDMQNGPRKLRHLISELKEICAIDGDMEVGQLLQEIINVVEHMPQLKVTFNLQAEIDLALQPLRNENSQLRRRLRILNQQLKERERREKEDSNPGMNFEMLHLQTENASLQRQLKEEREGCRKLSQYISEQQQKLEKSGKELQAVQYKVSEREHDKLLARQEHTQEINRLHQEVEMMSRRNESLQLKLASADRENDILQLNLKQRDLEITQLHTVLGNLKQGVTEVLQYFDQGVGDLNMVDNMVQKLMGFLRSSSQAYNPPKNDVLSKSSECEPLERSGNQRKGRTLRQDKGQLQEDKHATGHKEASRQGSSSSLTMAAVAAHNRHLEAVKDRTESFARRANFSFHSWDGTDLQQSFLGNRSQLYHSDPESMLSPHKQATAHSHQHHPHPHQRHHDHRQQKSQRAENSKQEVPLIKPLDVNQSNHTSPKTVERMNMNADNNRAETRSEDERLDSLSEIPISEADIDKSNSLNDIQMPDVAGNNAKDYLKKTPDMRADVRPRSLPRLSSSKLAEDVPAAEHSPLHQAAQPEEKNPLMSSPNSSATASASDVTQRDYFQGTELDLSLSTIQEDALSSVTCSTLTSSATAVSIDDRAFRQGIATLDENIAKVHEALQRTKKMFS